MTTLTLSHRGWHLPGSGWWDRAGGLHPSVPVFCFGFIASKNHEPAHVCQSRGWQAAAERLWELQCLTRGPGRADTGCAHTQGTSPLSSQTNTAFLLARPAGSVSEKQGTSAAGSQPSQSGTCAGSSSQHGPALALPSGTHSLEQQLLEKWTLNRPRPGLMDEGWAQPVRVRRPCQGSSPCPRMSSHS